MMPQWFARMTKREQRLALGVGAVVFLLLNFFIWSKLLGSIKQARTDLAARQATQKTQSVYMKEREMWASRDKWLKSHQPMMKNPSEASTLLDEVKQLAGKHNVLIENPAIGTGDSNANYQSAFASVETKSPWPALVRFLYDVQQPESFIVFENANVGVDGADPSMMRGKFKIARWFAAGGNKK